MHLKRGKAYRFHVNVNPEVDYAQRFYFTADPAGGVKGDACEAGYDPVKLPGTPEPAANGVMTLDVGKDLPKLFYYQSRDAKFCGGIVMVHDT